VFRSLSFCLFRHLLVATPSHDTHKQLSTWSGLK
jgi:hypothetical protein